MINRIPTNRLFSETNQTNIAADNPNRLQELNQRVNNSFSKVQLIALEDFKMSPDNERLPNRTITNKKLILSCVLDNYDTDLGDASPPPSPPNVNNLDSQYFLPFDVLEDINTDDSNVTYLSKEQQEAFLQEIFNS